MSVESLLSECKGWLEVNKSEPELRHFRSCLAIANHPQRTSIIAFAVRERLNPQGLERLPISGSGQWTTQNVGLLIDVIRSIAKDRKIISIDLRGEAHGFLDNFTVVLKSNTLDFNRNTNDSHFDELERKIVAAAAGKEVSLRINKVDQKVLVTRGMTEKTLMESLGINYIRIPIMDYEHPTDAAVEEILKVIREYSQAWIHWHCHVGKGRTTTAMAMCDMFYNAKQVAFLDILKRQRADKEGEDLLNLDKADVVRLYRCDTRLDFLKEFYLFCREVDPQIRSWLDWRRERKRVPVVP